MSEVHTWYERGDATGDRRGARTGLMDLSALRIPEAADVFMCGPLPFMRDVRASLVRSGVPSHRIRYEVFGPDMFAGETLSACSGRVRAGYVSLAGTPCVGCRPGP